MATPRVLTAEQLRKIAAILDTLNATMTDDSSVVLEGRLKIQDDYEELGSAVDDTGGCYMFEARVIE